MSMIKERIVLAPGINEGELLSSLALHGVNSIGLRIVGSGELARLALMRSGISIEKGFVNSREEAAIVAEAVKGIPYFDRISFADIQELAACIRTMRCLVTDTDEAPTLERTLQNGIFAEKNEALLRVYRKYMEILAERNVTDAISLIRRAVTECSVISAEFLTLKEVPLKPLERKLIERVSGGNATETSLAVLFGTEEKNIKVDVYRNCYGAPNEVETILAEVCAEKRLDQCMVAVTDTATYGQLFFDYALLYDLPITFGCGIPVINSNPARLLALYGRWCTSGFFGANALNEMLFSDVFDREKLYNEFPDAGDEHDFSNAEFLELLGSLRLTNNSATNEGRLAEYKTVLSGKDAQRKRMYLPWIEAASRELSLPSEEFIRKYSRLRKESGSNAQQLLMTLDRAALSSLYEELKVMRYAGFEAASEDMIPYVLRMNVCRQRSEAGKLHVTGITGAFTSVRPNLYLAGLAASKFPGTPRENYLLLDEDLELFGEAAQELKADGIILRRNTQLLNLVRLASALDTRISVSFSGLNVAELKKDNPSSLIYRLFREENGDSMSTGEMDAGIRKIGYFEPAISATRLIGEAYTKGKNIRREDAYKGESMPGGRKPDKAWSPSALEIFFSCPRRFYLKYILRIPEPEESDPFEIISSADIGTLAHSLMEELGGEMLSREEFRNLAEAAFDRFLKEHPPLIPENVPAVKDQFVEMMETAWEMDPGREVLLEEEDVCCTHESGVQIHGFPDRVEQLEDGSCLIVDFKTKRRVEHVQDDVDSCLQVVIYAYLMEKKGLKVSGSEYRYIRLGERVSCRYDEEIKKQLAEKLESFRTSMENDDFPLAEQPEEGENRPDPCRYCKYSEICGKASEEGDED